MDTEIARLINANTSETLRFTEAENWLVEQIALLMPGCRPDTTGVYLATVDAGIQASIKFWADGLRDGLSFANPRDFPSTLANSPAARIAIRHKLQGPNYTLVGGEDATLAALEHAQDDLLAHNIDFALVIRFDMSPVATVTAMQLTRSP